MLFSLLALKNCKSQTWRQPTSACERPTWRWQKFTESGTFCSEDDWSCEKNSIYPNVLYQYTRIYIIIMSYKDTWDGPCANQNNLRLVLDVSAVLHGSFPPSDGHLQLWSMGDNIVDPFGALIADGQWGQPDEHEASCGLFGFVQFSHLGWELLIQSTAKSHCFGEPWGVVEYAPAWLQQQIVQGIQHQISHVFSSFLTSLAMHDCLDLQRLWVHLFGTSQALQERSHVCIQREECNC